MLRKYDLFYVIPMQDSYSYPLNVDHNGRIEAKRKDKESEKEGEGGERGSQDKTGVDSR